MSIEHPNSERNIPEHVAEQMVKLGISDASGLQDDGFYGDTAACDGSKDCPADTHILGCFKSQKERS